MKIIPLSKVWLVKIFSHSVDCCFFLLTLSFALQKLLSFRRSHLLIASCSVYDTGVIFRKWLPAPILSSVLPIFLLWSSVWLALCWGLSSISTWVLGMVIDMDLFQFFYMLISYYASTISWITFLFSFYIFCFFLSKIRCL